MENILIDLKKDKIFKKVLSNNEYVKDIVNSYYEYIGENKKIAIKENNTQSHLIANTYESKEMYSDILAKTFYNDIKVELKNKDFFCIEMYSGNFGLEEYLKTKSYLDRIFSNQLKKGQKYIEAGKVTVICFMKGNFAFENPSFINRYGYAHKDTLKFVINEYEELILVRIDNIETSGYNEEERFVKWCKFFNAKSISELRNITKEDKVMDSATIDIINYLQDDYAWREYQYDLGNARRDGIDKGIEQTKLDVAKNMLIEGFEDDTILKISKISNEELNKLKQEKNVSQN